MFALIGHGDQFTLRRHALKKGKGAQNAAAGSVCVFILQVDLYKLLNLPPEVTPWSLISAPQSIQGDLVQNYCHARQSTLVKLAWLVNPSFHDIRYFSYCFTQYTCFCLFSKKLCQLKPLMWWNQYGGTLIYLKGRQAHIYKNNWTYQIAVTWKMQNYV